MEVTVQHQLGAAEAKQRILKLSADLKSRYPDQAGDLRENWQDNHCQVTGSVMGFALEYSLQVTDTSATVAGTLPWMARPMEGKITAAITDGLTKALKS